MSSAPESSEQSARASEDIVWCMAGKYQEIRSPEKYFCDESYIALVSLSVRWSLIRRVWTG